MNSEQLRQMINRILTDVEEEDIGISLLSRHYQNRDELSFFNETDREAVRQILEKLSKDSERHKTMLQDLIEFLGEKLHESRIS
ncbi:MAG TPA: hypothetical protein PLY88_05325 [Candidatus Omnitrophota bacterium]|nr:hypothetical protein [Candidatus Omnitrophota bacterium]